MYVTVGLWHVPLGLRVYRPLTVLIVIVWEVMKMEQTLHLGLLHVCASVWGSGKEEFVRTKIFLKSGGCWKTNLGLVGNIDLVSWSNLRMWKLECRICLTLDSLGWNWVIRAGGLGDAGLGFWVGWVCEYARRICFVTWLEW